ncbi:MAG: SlyX family protein [Sneathiella sp.]|nr:SlyX family protein [Sneathiella sp.]
MSDTTEERFTVLELKLMDQEQMVQDMSDILNNQWLEIERLKAKLSSAQDRLLSLEDNLPASSGAEKPPHY